MDTSNLAQHAGTAGTLFATIFVVASTTMKTMIPLRVFGILFNVALIGTAIPTRNYLVMAVQVVMLLLNSWRLHQMLQLIRDVRKSVNSDLSMDWLKPFMTERQCAAGEVLFYKDEKAEYMLYIVSGRFRLVESGIEYPVGAIVGELGMLSPSNTRTQTLECIEAGLILSRQLHQGRGALRAESGVRLLLPSPFQRPAVREHQQAGEAAGATGGGGEACMSVGSIRVFSTFRESIRYLFADIIGEQDDTPPFLPESLPNPSCRSPATPSTS